MTMPQEHVDHPLLRRVQFIPYIKSYSLLTGESMLKFESEQSSLCQVRELADEEVLQDTELRFEYVSVTST
jgi:hypothetical protein